MPKGSRTGKRVNPACLTGTSKPFSRIEIAPRLLAQFRGLSKEERQSVGKAIEGVRAAWGRPHLHAGIGLRKLKSNFFECRSGLKDRLVFELLPDGSLYFSVMGNHDDIQRFIKSS